MPDSRQDHEPGRPGDDGVLAGHVHDHSDHGSHHPCVYHTAADVLHHHTQEPSQVLQRDPAGVGDGSGYSFKVGGLTAASWIRHHGYSRTSLVLL